MFEDELEWTGIVVEPNLTEYAKLVLNRPNNQIHNCVLGPTGMATLDVNFWTAMSSVVSVLNTEKIPQYIYF